MFFGIAEIFVLLRFSNDCGGPEAESDIFLRFGKRILEGLRRNSLICHRFWKDFGRPEAESLISIGFGKEVWRAPRPKSLTSLRLWMDFGSRCDAALGDVGSHGRGPEGAVGRPRTYDVDESPAARVCEGMASFRPYVWLGTSMADPLGVRAAERGENDEFCSLIFRHLA